MAERKEDDAEQATPSEAAPTMLAPARTSKDASSAGAAATREPGTASEEPTPSEAAPTLHANRVTSPGMGGTLPVTPSQIIVGEEGDAGQEGTIPLRTSDIVAMADLEHEERTAGSVAGDFTPEAPGRYVTPDGPRELGRGGLGRVLLVHDSHLGRDVAVKELLLEPPGTGSNPNERDHYQVTAARFLREARITGQLEHPNIVPVYELGRRADGSVYYAMQMVRGKTLSKALSQCHTLAERLELLPRYVDLCQAVAYAHSRGVVHRDLKTENVMLGEFGETVLLDWGLAKFRGQRDLVGSEEVRGIVGSDPDLTAAGFAFGTPAYMAPEQARGELEEIDAQSDVFSLGAILYELLTGRKPYRADNIAEVILLAQRCDITPARKVEPDIPAELSSICRKALQAAKDRRYHAANRLAKDVEAWLTGGRVAAYDYTSWDLVRRFVVKNKVVAGFAALLLLTLIVGSILIFNQYRKADASRQLEKTARVRAEAARKREHEARQRATEAERAAADRALQMQLALARSLARRASTFLRRHRRGEAGILAAAALEAHPAWRRQSPSSQSLSPLVRRHWRDLLSRAQNVLYDVSVHRTLRLERWLASSKQRIWAIVASPRGETLAYGGERKDVVLVRRRNAKVVARLEAPGPAVVALAYSRDGRLLAAGGRGGQVRIWDTTTRQVVRTIDTKTGFVASLVFEPSGKWLATGGTGGDVKLWHPASGRQLGTVKTGDQQTWALAVDREGKYLAAAGVPRGAARLHLIDLRFGRVVASLAGARGPLWRVAFSPDGRLVAAGGFDERVRLWDVQQRHLVEALPAQGADVTALGFSPDGRTLVVGVRRGGLSVWRGSPPSLVSQLQAHAEDIWSLDWLDRGRGLVTAGLDGTMRIWKLAAGPLVPLLATGTTVVSTWVRGERVFGWGLDGRLHRFGDGGKKRLAPRGPFADAVRIALDPSGERVAIARRDGTIWTARGAAPAVQVPGVRCAPPVRRLRFAARASVLLVGCFRRSYAIEIRPGAAPPLVRTLKLLGASDVSPDGKAIVAVREGQVAIVDAKNGRRLRAVPGTAAGQVAQARYLVDGSLVVDYGDHRVFWLPRAGKPKSLGRYREELSGAWMSPNHALIVTLTRRGVVRVIDTKSGQQVLNASLPETALGLAFSPDGASLVVPGVGGIRRYPVLRSGVWDLEPAKLLGEMEKAVGLQLKGHRMVVQR